MLKDDLSPRQIIDQALAKHPPPDPGHLYKKQIRSGITRASCTCGWIGSEFKAAQIHAYKEFQAHCVETRKPTALLAHDYIEVTGKKPSSRCTCGWQSPERSTRTKAGDDWERHRKSFA